jgi:hypothetical protein
MVAAELQSSPTQLGVVFKVTATELLKACKPLLEHVVRMRKLVVALMLTVAVALVAEAILSQVLPPFVDLCHW